MRAHVIKDGIVVNTIEVDSLDFMPGLIDGESGGKIGDLWDGAQFSSAPPEPEPVPKDVTRRQGLQALYIEKQITEDMIHAKINEIEDADQRYLAMVECNTSQVFERNRPLVTTLGAMFGMTSDEMDDLFRFAATL